MKGIPNVCIENHDLGSLGVYESLYRGDIVEFDLVKFCVCMDFGNKNLGKYTVINRDEFKRKLKFEQKGWDENEMYKWE